MTWSAVALSPCRSLSRLDLLASSPPAPNVDTRQQGSATKHTSRTSELTCNARRCNFGRGVNLPCQDGGVSGQRRGRNSPRHGHSVAVVRQDWTHEVARSAAADAGGVNLELLGDFLDRLAAGPEHSWDRHPNAAFAALGARAAEQGVALRTLVDLYLSAAWRAWPRLPAVTGEDTTAIRAAGQWVLRACDDVVAALAEGYASARRAMVRREEALRREFVDDLLAGTADPAALLVRAQSYGLQLAGPHAVLLARTAAPFQEASPLLAQVSTALADPLSAFDTLITTRDGELVIVLPALPAQTLDAVLAAAHRVLTSGAQRTQQVWMVLGRPHPGPSGVAHSFTEARNALTLAKRLQLSEPVVRAEDLLVYQVLLRDRAALCDLIDTVLTPLRRARGGAEPLLATLEAYLGSGGNTTRTAKLLHLSVRAVTYRLHRIATLTGLHVGNPAHRYTLHTAVLGARALGWPNNTEVIAEPRQ
jgi:GGDEF-like domain/PucR C-terminal helix-turn-helix domain